MRRLAKLTALDLFAGAGGMTAGLRDAGVDVIAAAEIDSDSIASYQANHPGVKLLGDVRTLTGSDILQRLERKTIDLVVGCPPCQGFSRLTEKHRRLDPRNDLVLHFVRLVTELRPAVCMMENVPGLVTRGGRLFRALVSGLKDAGYVVNYDVLELADYGVPQFRKRLVLLAGRGFNIPIPKPTHKGRWRTLKDAIGDLPSPPSRKAVLLGSEKPKLSWHFKRDSSARVTERLTYAAKNGGSRRDFPSHLRLRCHAHKLGGFNDVYGVLKWERPCVTITSGCTNASKGRFGHPAEPRPLTAREAAIIQTLGKKYKLCGKGVDSVALQIGNALPRRFAFVAGRHILKTVVLNTERR
jgi:DNA (cytosine-5)-methyltransferase 1